MISKVSADGKLIFKQYSYSWILLMSGTQNFSGYYDLYMFKSCMPLRHWLTVDLNCVCPPQKGFCLRPHPIPTVIPIKPHTFLEIFWSYGTPAPHPQEIQSLLWGRVWIFFGHVQCVYISVTIFFLWNHSWELNLGWSQVLSHVNHSTTNNCIFNNLLTSAAFLKHFNSILTVQHCFNYKMQ